MKKIIAIALVIAALLSLSACGRGNKFTADGIAFVDKKTDVKYNFAPFCYEPIVLVEEVYGSDGDIDFYPIIGQDPLKWLGTKDGGVFYAEGETLPKLDEMLVSRIEICTDTDSLLIRNKISESDKIDWIISDYLAAESHPYPNVTPDVYYKLRFVDQSRGIYYCLDYMRFHEGYRVYADGYETVIGTDFIYNRSEDRFVRAPILISDLIDGKIELN